MVQAPNRIISSQEAELWPARTCLHWKSALAAAVVRPCLQGIGNWAVTAHPGQYFRKRPPSEPRALFFCSRGGGFRFGFGTGSQRE
jgi:hypothetical protein